MYACTLEAARLTAFAITQLGSLEDQICTQFVRNLLPRVWVSVYRGACMEGEGGGCNVCACLHAHLYTSIYTATRIHLTIAVHI